MEYLNGLTKLYLKLTIARTGSICCKIGYASPKFWVWNPPGGFTHIDYIIAFLQYISFNGLFSYSKCILYKGLTDWLRTSWLIRWLTDWLNDWLSLLSTNRPPTEWVTDRLLTEWWTSGGPTNRLINRWQTKFITRNDWLTDHDWLNDWPQFLQFVSGYSQLCYSCPKSASMEECDAQRTLYNCSMTGSFQTKCARFCDWKNGVHYRECAMDLKCERIQLKCEERMAMQDQKTKELECEYECCEGNLCNTDPCNLGSSIRPRLMTILGAVFSVSYVITFCF